jgi:hypothetical protein
MRSVARVLVDCGDLGRRVTVRQRDSTGGFNDIVGILETCDDDSFVIRDRTGKLRYVSRREVVAAKVVPPPPDRPPRTGR